MLRLAGVQRLAALLILGVLSSNLSEMLERLLELLPIVIHVKMVARLGAYALQCEDFWVCLANPRSPMRLKARHVH